MSDLSENNKLLLAVGGGFLIGAAGTFLFHTLQKKSKKSSISQMEITPIEKKVQLGYWKIRGLAQPIRFLLEFTGTDYQEKRYEQGDGPEFSRKEWLDEKDTLGLAFPNLPYLIDGELKITQSQAISRYIARKHGLLGKTEAQAAQVDMLLGVVADWGDKTGDLYYGNAADFQKNLAAYDKDFLPPLLSKLEAFLGSKDFFTGDITLADFWVFEHLEVLQILLPNKLAAYPKLKTFSDRMNALPSIAKYKNSVRYLAWPVNNKSAAWVGDPKKNPF